MRLAMKCKCTDGEVGLSVRDRYEDEDIRNYMKQIEGHRERQHLAEQKRGCAETKLEYLKVPIVRGKPIGVSA